MLNKTDLVQIFSKLKFNSFKLHDLDFIEMNTYEAFIFSSITGSSYLINEVGVSMKGRNEVFIHRSIFQNDKYIYSPGLFSRDLDSNYILENSADILNLKYPSIFKGNKIILIYEIDKNSSSNVEEKIFHYLSSKGMDTKDIILYKYFKTGSSFEPFLEYLTTKFFLEKGYLVENQVPWFQQKFSFKGKNLNGGIPDFSAFHSPSSSSELYRYGLITENKGIILNMIPLLKNFDEFDFKENKIYKEFQYELIIGEAKANKNSLDQAIKQLSQYEEVQLGTEFYTIICDVDDNNMEKFGEIYLNNHELEKRSSKKDSITDIASQEKDDKWMNNYIKALLLGNLSEEEINELINSFRTLYNLPILKNYKSYHLIDMVIGTDINIILKKVKEVI